MGIVISTMPIYLYQKEYVGKDSCLFDIYPERADWRSCTAGDHPCFICFSLFFPGEARIKGSACFLKISGRNPEISVFRAEKRL